MFRAPSHERTETTTKGVTSVLIVDGRKDKFITLVPATKHATVTDLKNVPLAHENPFGKTFLGLQELVAQAESGKIAKVERLGAETIDGRPAQGFRVEIGALVATIWADPKTLLPVRVEESSSSGPDVRIVMSDFQIDVDLDESLFSLDVPANYTIVQTPQFDLAKQPISYLAATLKKAAELNNGVFPTMLRGPDGIDGLAERFAKTIMEKQGKDSANSMKQATDLTMEIGGAFGFLFALSTDHDWHYAGKDVKLNTPDRPIFWYRAHKASTTYTILYADLSIKEVPAEQLPKLPAAEK
jgi:outer membrane lipoprotein-sorting protein